MSHNPNEILENEWTYIFDVNELADKPASLTLTPDEDEKKRLAQRLGILALNDLSADLTLSMMQGNVSVHIDGRFKADLTQNCVVSLEPVHETLDERFQAWFTDPDQAISFAKARKEQLSKGGNQDVQILDEKDDPEPIIDDKIDLGELVTQYLCLAINPYPHAEGVHFEVGDDASQAEQDKQSGENPFAALKDWKMRLNEEEH